MILALRLFLISASVAAPVLAARPPKIPGDAPYCAPQGARPVFLSPMGEPFRVAAGQPYPSATWVAAADSDGDGHVSRAEFVADASRFFKAIDLDHDGRITPEEVIAYERDVAPEIALYGPRQRDYVERAGKARAGESGYGGAMGAGRYSWLNIPQPVSSGDTDFNRVVDETEYTQAASRRFDTLAQGAGMLSLGAMPRTPLQIAIEGPCHPRPKPKAGKPGERRDGAEADGDRRQEGPR